MLLMSCTTAWSCSDPCAVKDCFRQGAGSKNMSWLGVRRAVFQAHNRRPIPQHCQWGQAFSTRASASYSQPITCHVRQGSTVVATVSRNLQSSSFHVLFFLYTFLLLFHAISCSDKQCVRGAGHSLRCLHVPFITLSSSHNRVIPSRNHFQCSP